MITLPKSWLQREHIGLCADAWARHGESHVREKIMDVCTSLPETPVQAFVDHGVSSP